MKEFKQYLIDREIRNGVYVYSVWKHRVCGMYQQIFEGTEKEVDAYMKSQVVDCDVEFNYKRLEDVRI